MMVMSRTKAVYKVLNSKGRFFTIKWVAMDGKHRIANCKMRRKDVDKVINGDKIFGHITIYDVNKLRFRTVDARKITYLSIDHNKYKIK